MNQKTYFIYVGSETTYTGSKCHAFYSPFYDKMWCFNYSDWDNYLVLGEAYDLAIPFLSHDYIIHNCESKDIFIGDTRHIKCRDIALFKKLYGGRIFRDFNEEDNAKKVWAF